MPKATFPKQRNTEREKKDNSEKLKMEWQLCFEQRYQHNPFDMCVQQEIDDNYEGPIGSMLFMCALIADIPQDLP